MKRAVTASSADHVCDPIAGPDWNDSPRGPNTHVAGFAGTTWAMVEAGGCPVELTYELETVGRKQRLVRLSERDADRMMPWLLWNAGYDPRGAVRWMSQWGTRYTFLNRKRTHDAWDERVAAIEAEIATLAALTAQEGWQRGEADWKRHFRAEFVPALAAETRR